MSHPIRSETTSSAPYVHSNSIGENQPAGLRQDPSSTIASSVQKTQSDEPTFFSKAWSYISWPFVKMYNGIRWLLCCCYETDPSVIRDQAIYEPETLVDNLVAKPKETAASLLDSFIKDPAEFIGVLDDKQVIVDLKEAWSGVDPKENSKLLDQLIPVKILEQLEQIRLAMPSKTCNQLDPKLRALHETLSQVVVSAISSLAAPINQLSKEIATKIEGLQFPPDHANKKALMFSLFNEAIPALVQQGADLIQDRSLITTLLSQGTGFQAKLKQLTAIQSVIGKIGLQNLRTLASSASDENQALLQITLKSLFIPNPSRPAPIDEKVTVDFVKNVIKALPSSAFNSLEKVCSENEYPFGAMVAKKLRDFSKDSSAVDRVVDAIYKKFKELQS